MLNAIKNALTYYSEQSKLDMKCTEVTKVGNTINVSLVFTDMATGKVTPISTSMNVPEVVQNDKTMINIAICKGGRSCRVYNNGNFTVGRYADPWTIDFTRGTDTFMIRHGRDIVYPLMNPSGKGMVQSFPSLMIFNYFPGLKSETYLSFPDLTPEAEAIIKEITQDFELSDCAFQGIQIYTKGMLKDKKFNKELLQALLFLEDNKLDFVDKVLPIDYEVGTYENLIRDAISRNRSIGYKVMNSFIRNGSVSLYALTSTITEIGRTDRTNGLNVVQADMNTNALSHLAQRDKTYFRAWSGETKKYEPEALDPKYFIGIIDPVFTADSALINVKNELARSAVISDEQFKVRLMTPDFKPIIVSAYECLSSIVLSQDNVDYVNQKIVPSDSGDYNVYQWGEDFYIKDPDKIKYIRFEDSILSESVAMLPFANKTQAMRVMLGSHMIAEQSVPVIGATPSILYTDVHKETYEQSKQVIRAKKEGTVLGVGENYINIDGEAVKVERELPTSNHTTVTYKHQVKPGDQVHVGSVLSQSNSFVNNEFCTNVPLLTAYTGFYAQEHEDAVVISQSAARRFGHPDTYEVVIPVKYHDIKINYITPTDTLDEFSLVKNDAWVKPGDTLFAYSTSIDLVNSNALRAEVAKVPYGIDGGVAKVRFRIYKSKRTQGADNEKYKRYNGLSDLYNHFKERAETDLMKEKQATNLTVAKLRKDFEFVEVEPSLSNTVFMEIIITIDYINKVKMSDKITNQYGKHYCCIKTNLIAGNSCQVIGSLAN